MEKRVYEVIAKSFKAYKTVIQDWKDVHETNISHIMANKLPSGSGLNCTEFNYEESKNNRLVFNNSYHVMNSNGYYEGWIDFKVIITPDLAEGFDIKIIGKFGSKNQDIKEYLIGQYSEALESGIGYPTY